MLVRLKNLSEILCKDKALSVVVAFTLVVQITFLYTQLSQRSGARSSSAAVETFTEQITFDLKTGAKRGNPAAKIVLIEFSDFECPYCKRHSNGVGLQIREMFVETGRIQHVFMNYPLPIHPNADLLARATLCAGKQGRYWEMHDFIFSNGASSETDLLSYAQQTGSNAQSLALCLKTREFVDQIAYESQIAEKLGVAGTPSFAIGYLDPAGYARIKFVVRGARPFDVFESVIQKLSNERFENLSLAAPGRTLSARETNPKQSLF